MKDENLDFMEELKNMTAVQGFDYAPKREASKAGFSLGRMPFSAKLFISLMLGVAALCYAALIGSIWNDTEMRIAYILEGYGSMESMELTSHSFKYLFWFFGIFSLTVGLFLLSDYSEKLKTFYALTVPVFIVSDIGSAWLISSHAIFAYILYGSGLILAMAFLSLFILLQSELWSFKKNKAF